MSEFTKFDQGKPPLSILFDFPNTLTAVSHILQHGAVKYGRSNFLHMEPDECERYESAAQRHLMAYHNGEYIDADSGSPHLANAIASLMIVLEYQSYLVREPVDREETGTIIGTDFNQYLKKEEG